MLLVVFTTDDLETSADIQAENAIDTKALDIPERKGDVIVEWHIAKLRGNEIWIPIHGSNKLEEVQAIFHPKIRAATRWELLQSIREFPYPMPGTPESGSDMQASQGRLIIIDDPWSKSTGTIPEDFEEIHNASLENDNH